MSCARRIRQEAMIDGRQDPEATTEAEKAQEAGLTPPEPIELRGAAQDSPGEGPQQERSQLEARFRRFRPDRADRLIRPDEERFRQALLLGGLGDSQRHIVRNRRQWRGGYGRARASVG